MVILTTVTMKNFLFPMNNCVVKASESNKNLTNLLKKFCVPIFNVKLFVKAP